MRKTTIVVIAAMVCWVMVGTVCADGMFYGPETVPIEVSDQRAVITCFDDSEVLLLQSSYSVADSNHNANLAWVVPVPSVPKFRRVDPKDATSEFQWLNRECQPRVILVWPTLIGWGVVAAVLLCLGIAIRRRMWAHIVLVILLISFGALFFLGGPQSGALSASSSGESVQILKEETVGVYDVKVIGGTTGIAIRDWLDQNGFVYAKSSERAFDGYVKKGWCFVTAKVNRTRHKSSSTVGSDGMVAPLCMRFSTKEIVYPMALTATAGGSTDVLIYIVGQHKMKCDGSLKLEYAGYSQWFGRYLTKFRGRLSPGQMKKDMVFRYAGNDRSYKKLVLRWRHQGSGGLKMLWNPSFEMGFTTLDLSDPNALLRQGAKDGDVQAVQKAIAEGASLSTKDGMGMSSLMWAAKNNDVEMAGLLLDKGAEIDAGTNSFTALRIALNAGYVEVIRLLLDRGADVNAAGTNYTRALTEASESGHVEVVKFLLDRGVDVNAKGADDTTALMAASESGHVEVVKLLLDRGADVNGRHFVGGTALIVASGYGHLEAVKLLLDKGADVNSPTFGGFTPLMAASASGRLEVARLLLDRGADINAHMPDGKTARRFAEMYRAKEVMRLLDKAGAKEWTGPPPSRHPSGR